MASATTNIGAVYTTEMRQPSLSFSVLEFIASGQIIYKCYSSIRDEFFRIVKLAKLSLRTFTFGPWARQGACVRVPGYKFSPITCTFGWGEVHAFYQFLKEAEVSRHRRAMIS